MHKSKLKQISLAVCLAWMPAFVFAAGLGKLNVNSGLGEPLKAEIELLSLSPDELASLSATVAPEEAYAVQGIPRLSIHNNIKVELVKAADGSPILKLSSAQPVTDPYLDMLIQVDWAAGRLLREYTLLLDPPEYKSTVREAIAEPSSIIDKPASVVSNNVAIPASQADTDKTSETKTTAVKQKKTKVPAAKIQPEQNAETIEATPEEAQVTTQRGDSLAAIARDYSVEGVSLEQMLIGLFEANKHAFVDGNMNRLKVGQILKVPSKDALLATDSRQAAQEVKVHSANWNVYRNSLAANVVAVDSSDRNQAGQSASGKISTAEDLAVAKKAGPQDVVKLSAGAKLADNKGVAEYDAKILALQEEATVKEKALKEAQDRTSALEAQIADMQKLLTLKNQAMANAEKSAEAQKSPSPTAEVKSQQPAPEVAPVPEVKPEPVKPSETAKASETAKMTEVPAPVTAPNVAPVQAADAQKSAPKPAVTPAQSDAEQLSLLDSIFAAIDLLMLAVAGGIALLVAAWAFVRNKRRRDLDSFERGILTSGGLSANTVFGNTTGSASTSDTSFLTDFAQSTDGSMIDANDVDPIAEAEVYMAYGRDAQAEEILKDAITKEPKRYELHLKLLEMYAGRKDISAFEAIAGELYTSLGSDHPIWGKVAELGITVEPDNPLYDLSRLSALPAAESSPDVTAESMVSSIEKELDWEKGLALDKELAATSDFSGNVKNDSIEIPVPSFPADAGEVITQFGNASAELTQEQSLDFKQPVEEAVLNSEMAVFSKMAASPTQEQALSETTETQVGSEDKTTIIEDNSLNFDFSELGKFSTDNPAASDSEAEVEAIEITAPTDSSSDSMAFAPALALPESVTEAPASDQVSSAENNAFNFNFESAAQASALELTEPSNFSFEVVDFEEAEPDGTSADELSDAKSPNLVMPDFSGINLDLSDDPATESLESEAVKPDEVQFDLPVVVDTIEIKTPVENPKAIESSFDLSTISLNLSDAPADSISSAGLPVESVENPDVDIKLDLVRVYIDMDDVEGARDLLDEVMKEGGPNQRQTAEQLLASLR